MAPELRADAARNRARVLATARAQLAEHGSALPMNEIARQAGVGVGTVYRHFPTRQALLEALVVDSLARLASEADRACAEPNPLTALERLLRSAFGLLADSPGLDAVLADGAPQYPEALNLLGGFAASVDQVLARARADGVVRAELAADDIRRLMCGMQHAIQTGGDVASKVDLYAQVLVAGLKAPEGAARADDSSQPPARGQSVPGDSRARGR